MPLDRVDLAIVEALRADARLSIRQLSERVHLSRTAAHTRVQRLIETGVIRGFTAIVDDRALGLNVSALVVVTISGSWPDLERRLAALPYVEKVQAVSGDIDFVLTVRAPDHEKLSDVVMRQVHELPGVATTRTYIVLDEVSGRDAGPATIEPPAGDDD